MNTLKYKERAKIDKYLYFNILINLLFLPSVQKLDTAVKELDNESNFPAVIETFQY